MLPLQGESRTKMPVIVLPNGQSFDTAWIDKIQVGGRDSTCIRTTFGTAAYLHMSHHELIDAALQQGVDLRRHLETSRLMPGLPRVMSIGL